MYLTFYVLLVCRYYETLWLLSFSRLDSKFFRKKFIVTPYYLALFLVMYNFSLFFCNQVWSRHTSTTFAWRGTCYGPNIYFSTCPSLKKYYYFIWKIVRKPLLQFRCCKQNHYQVHNIGKKRNWSKAEVMAHNEISLFFPSRKAVSTQNTHQSFLV